MKIKIVVIGKIKEKYLTDAVKEYQKRIFRFSEIEIIEQSDAPQGKTLYEQRTIEGERLLEKASGYIVALDCGGKQLSSEELAALLDEKCTFGISEFSFLVGGSHGHSEEVKKKADLILSFGKLTFPHQLFRVMLLEQVYRALTINAGTPYHK